MRRSIDITELATLGEQFSLRLMRLGFRLMQVIDATGRDQLRYVVPPVCNVPAGPFLMGSNRCHDPQANGDYLPQVNIDVPAFQIGRYPVTVAEYDCAVQAGIVDEPQSNNSITWQGQLRCLDRPVVCVTWHQARDYAAWFAEITQRPWRLPTDAEWERASQGTYGRSFPWGNHTTPSEAEERDIRVMMPVGSYPQEASHYGVQDMVGLMYEWTGGTIPGYFQSKHARAADPSEYLALRCGWWGYTSEYEHVAFSRATGFLPDAFTYNLGVRLALSPDIEP